MADSDEELRLPDRTAGVLTPETIECGGARVELLVGGSGPPLLLLHGVDGGMGWDDVVRGLTENFTVYAPSHPGFNGSSRPAWIATMPDLAAWYGWLLDDLPAPVAAVGYSIGGWLAAEIAVRSGAFDRLILIDAMGLAPLEGEIADIFLLSGTEFAERAFRDPAARQRYLAFLESNLAARWMLDRNMEMSAMIGWKPYMVDPALHGLLPRLRAPARIVWGADDGIVPLGCGQRFQELIPDADLIVMADCGHYPHYERPDDLVKTVNEFLL